jgi:hypothetical protein
MVMGETSSSETRNAGAKMKLPYRMEASSCGKGGRVAEMRRLLAGDDKGALYLFDRDISALDAEAHNNA